MSDPRATGTWPVRAAKDHFGELVERCQTQGPQVITRRGKVCAMVVSQHEYQALLDAMVAEERASDAGST